MNHKYDSYYMTFNLEPSRSDLSIQLDWKPDFWTLKLTKEIPDFISSKLNLKTCPENGSIWLVYIWISSKLILSSFLLEAFWVISRPFWVVLGSLSNPSIEKLVISKIEFGNTIINLEILIDWNYDLFGSYFNINLRAQKHHFWVENFTLNLETSLRTWKHHCELVNITFT